MKEYRLTLLGGIAAFLLILPFRWIPLEHTVGVIGALAVIPGILVGILEGPRKAAAVTLVGVLTLLLLVPPMWDWGKVIAAVLWMVVTIGVSSFVAVLKRQAAEERTTIAVELHDGPIQEIVAVMLLIELNRIDEARRALDEALNDAKALVFRLRSQKITFDTEKPTAKGQHA